MGLLLARSFREAVVSPMVFSTFNNNVENRKPVTIFAGDIQITKIGERTKRTS